MTASLPIAIIGAGITGLSAARALQAAGLAPRIFDKSRGIGGRLATRRGDGGLSLDHGAPFVTASSAGFRALLAELVDQEAAAIWGPTGPWRGRKPWHVGLPGMSGMARALAEGLDIVPEAELSAVSRDGAQWRLDFADGRAPVMADQVVLTVPAPQAARLVATHPLADRLTSVEMAPCLTMMVAFDQPLGLLFDVLKAPSAALAWVIRNASKPGRTKLPETWVAHATPEWSAAHLEAEKPQIAQAMFDLLPDAMEVDLPVPVHLSGHRWRYALATQPLGEPFLEAAETGLFIGGDWCLGPTAEHGWQSGVAIADAIMQNRTTLD